MLRRPSEPERAVRVGAPLLVAAVVLSLAAAACGGDTPARSSRAALVRKADAICQAGLREADRLRSKAVIGARGDAAAAEIDASLAVLDRQTDGLDALRGPASTDADLAHAVEQLRRAAEGLGRLRDAAAADDLTIDEAIRRHPQVVEQINLASAEANDALAALGFLECIGVGAE